MGYAINSNMRKFAQSAQQTGASRQVSGVKVSAASNLKRSTITKNVTLDLTPNVTARRSGIASGNGRISYQQYRRQNAGLGWQQPMQYYVPQQTTTTIENKPSFWEELIQVGGSIAMAMIGAKGKAAASGNSKIEYTDAQTPQNTASSSISSPEISGLTTAQDSAALGQAISTASTRLTQLQGAVAGKSEDTLQSNIEAAKTQITDTKSEITENIGAIHQNEQTVSSLESRNQSFESQIEQLKSNNPNGTNNAKITELQNKINVNKQNIADAKAKINELKTKNDEINNEILPELENNLESAQTELATFKSNNEEIKKLDKSIKKAESKKGQMIQSENKKLNKLNKEIRELQAKQTQIMGKGNINSRDGVAKPKETKDQNKFNKLEEQIQEKQAEAAKLQQILAQSQTS